MKISSGVTSYLYDPHRDVAQKRRYDDVTANPQQPRLTDHIDKKGEETLGSLVEQVVEGELLNNRQDFYSGDVLKFSRLFHSAETGFVPNGEPMGFTTAHAIEQYRTYFMSEDTHRNRAQGQQVDLYV